MDTIEAGIGVSIINPPQDTNSMESGLQRELESFAQPEVTSVGDALRVTRATDTAYYPNIEPQTHISDENSDVLNL